MQPGLNLLIPIVDRVRVYHDLRIQQTNVPPQKVITKDNVQVEIDTIIFYQVVEPELATYGISNYEYGVRNIQQRCVKSLVKWNWMKRYLVVKNFNRNSLST